jgi:hypothetical protein
MRLLILILLTPILLLAQKGTGTIKGTVVDVNSKEPLISATVILVGTDYGVATNENGYYDLKDIPFGTYVIRSSYLIYVAEEDTIQLTSKNTVVQKDFQLDFMEVPISMPDSLKEYHQKFEGLEAEKIIEFRIDSVKNHLRDVYFTFKNKTNHTVYLIEDLLCFNTINIIVRNERGEKIKTNVVDLACDVIGLNYLPQKENLIELSPNDSVKIMSANSEDYNFNYYPKGKYYISAKYKIKDWKYLPGAYNDPDMDYDKVYKEEIYVLNRATRGTFCSENKIVYENKH